MKNRRILKNIHWYIVLIVSMAILLAVGLNGKKLSAQESSQVNSEPLRIYSTMYDTAEHPDHNRYSVTPPTWKTFDGRTQFICLRSIPGDPAKLAEELNRYQSNDLGRFIWPYRDAIFFKRLEEIADEIKQRNLYLFDIWGYVPGNGPYDPDKPGDWIQFRVDPKQCKILKEKLGDHWLGMDNGEQDGRYIGSFSNQIYPRTNNRNLAYFLFQRHFEQLGDDLCNRLATLVSLNFGHYFLKEGVYTLIGAEAAQALPNSQVYYSWIRGAGKQYGVLWFGNASVYNRWGWKDFSKTGKPDQYGPGATKGASLNLLKRLLYSHLLYNSAAVGFESGWFIGDQLSPIGKIQQSANRWLQKNGMPGTMISQTAVLTDFQCGWSFPRHLYTGFTYRVWGRIPYESGDYLTNNVMNLIYPGYQDSSYFHDESGFLTPTPYSDSADNLLSDAPLWLLIRYPLIIAAGNLNGRTETKNKLLDYVRQGGRLILTAGNIAEFHELAGISVSSKQNVDPSEPILFSDGLKVRENSPFDLYGLNLPLNAEILAKHKNLPVAAKVPCGKGFVIVLASEWGIPSKSTASKLIDNKTDKHLLNPFPMLDHVRTVMDHELNRTVLFEVGDDLGSIVCRKEKGVYTIGIFNNDFKEKPFQIKSKIGKIESIEELPIDISERSEIGFLPEGFEKTDCGKHSDKTIAGVDVRIFEVRVQEQNVVEIPHNIPDPNPKNRFLSLRGHRPLKEQILMRPSFFQYFDGVVIDWKYLHERTAETVKKEAAWLHRQKVRIAVDFTSGMNLFPDLRLVKNDMPEYEKSLRMIREVIDKAAIWNAETVIIRGHNPPTIYDEQQAFKDMREAYAFLGKYAQSKKITLAIRIGTCYPRDITEMKQVAEADPDHTIRFIPSLSHLNELFGINPSKENLDKTAFILMTSALNDLFNGVYWTENAPLYKGISETDAFKIIHKCKDIPLFFDAFYENQDEEYRDQMFIKSKGL